MVALRSSGRHFVGNASAEQFIRSVFFPFPGHEIRLVRTHAATSAAGVTRMKTKILTVTEYAAFLKEHGWPADEILEEILATLEGIAADEARRSGQSPDSSIVH